MKTKFKMVLGLLLLCAGLAQAQAPNDVIYLENGGFVRGTIIEYFPEGNVKIRTEEGKIYEYPASEITKYKVEHKRASPLKSIEKGYVNNSSIGLMLGRGNYGLVRNFGFQMGHFYQFKSQYLAGLSMGIEDINYVAMMPLFAEFRYLFKDKGFSPYVGAYGGPSIPLVNNDYMNYSPGPAMGLRLGVLNRSHEHFGFNFEIGYRHQRNITNYDQSFWNGFDVIYFPVSEQRVINRIDFRIGFFFN